MRAGMGYHGGNTGGGTVTYPGRSQLRRWSMLLFVACAATVTVGPALGAEPAPDPSPRRSPTPAPEPVPTGTRQPATTATTETPPPPAAQTPPPAPATVSSTPPAVVASPRPAATTAERSRATRATRRRAPKKAVKVSTARRAKQAVGAKLPALRPADPRSPDTMLLVGGIALVVLVIADTAFLAASKRRVAGS